MRIMTRYSIVRLIWEGMKAQNIGRKTLVDKAGYRNITKGLRRLDDLLYRGILLEEFIFKAGLALGFSGDEISESIKETRKLMVREKEEYERSIFQPHIYVRTVRSYASSWFGGLGNYSHKKIYYPGYAGESDDAFDESIGELIRNHFMEHKGVIGGGYGTITGYVCWLTYDDRIEFNTDGKRIIS